MATDEQTPRPLWAHKTRWQLLRPLVGGWIGKLRRLVSVLSAMGRPRLVRERLERLRDLGYVHDVPSMAQLWVAGHHMMLGVASDETRIWYEERGIHFTFHNLRRFLDYPASMVDPIGVFLDRDTLVHHVLQSTHGHPVYDLQLLAAHPGGLEEMERRAALVLEGRDEAQERLDVLVEDPTYHARLLPQVRAFRADPLLRAPLRDYAHVDDPLMRRAMDQFRDLRGYTSYAARLDVSTRHVLGAAAVELFKATLGRLWPRPPVQLHLAAFDADTSSAPV